MLNCQILCTGISHPVMVCYHSKGPFHTNQCLSLKKHKKKCILVKSYGTHQSADFLKVLLAAFSVCFSKPFLIKMNRKCIKNTSKTQTCFFVWHVNVLQVHAGSRATRKRARNKSKNAYAFLTLFLFIYGAVCRQPNCT